MINIGTEIGGYKVTAMANGYALAVSETAPNPFVVWTLDDDGEGVCVGHYFNEREDAEWDFCARAFEWFEDNMNITITEDIAVSDENTAPLHEYLNGIKEAREAVAKAAQMVEEMCDELDKLKAERNIPPKIDYISQCVGSGWENHINSVKETIDYINSINQRLSKRGITAE